MSLLPHRKPRSKKLKRQLQIKPPGTAPETLVADPAAPMPVLHVIGYSAATHEEVGNATVDQVRTLYASGKYERMWLNVDGLGDAETVRKVGEIFGLHKLALEDVLSPRQRAKVDEFQSPRPHMFIVLREPQHAEQFDTDQVCVFLGSNFVVTFQERHGDCLGPVRERIRQSRGKICGSGPDYLAYSIIDAVVDAYFPVLEHYGERLEVMEDQAVDSPTSKTVHNIHGVKRELLVMRRAVWPLREAIGVLVREDNHLVSAETRVYLRDAYDHAVQLIDMLENFRELGSDLMDIYLSSQSHRLNEVMKVLTVIATLFMPLSFIVGVYGMNFDTRHPANMPELDWAYGYVFVWIIILIVSATMLTWFYRRGWIGFGRWKA